MKTSDKQLSARGPEIPRRSRVAVFSKKLRTAFNWRFARFIKKLESKRSLSVTLVNNHEEFGGARQLDMLSNRQTDFSSPLLLDEHLKVIRQPPITMAVPDVYFLELADVEVVGATMAVLRNGKVFHPELLHTDAIHDIKAPDIYRFTDAGRRSLDFDVFTRIGGQKQIRVGVHMLKEHAHNYYHWLSECLPRLVYFIENKVKTGELAEITILIDGNVMEQYVESMRRLINFPCEIVRVKRGELVKCDRLFYVSPFWYSLDNTKHKVNPYKDLAVDKYAIGLVRNSFCKSANQHRPSRKLYFPRKADQIRKIINAQQVEDLMRENGFEIVQAHEFSFLEQIELFSHTQIVIGASGAVFTNMIFMQPGSKAVIFSPKQLEVFNYYIFQQQADVAQVELMHFLATPAKQEGFSIHDDFYVNCDDLRALVQRLTEADATPLPLHSTGA